MWDGLRFFSFDDNKLDRLQGRKVKWYDKLKNKRWMIANFIALIIIIGIIIDHLNRLG